MSTFLFFIIFSAIWAAADHFIAPPIASLIAMVRGGEPRPAGADQAAGSEAPEGITTDDDRFLQAQARFAATNLGIAECLVGIGLGFVAGLVRGHLVLAVSFTTSAWSWVATICLIIASLVGAALRLVLELVITQLALS